MILYQGLLSSPASWARVGRGYLAAWLRGGIAVAAVRARGFRYDPAFELPAGLRMIDSSEARRVPAPAIGLGFLHPPHLDRLIGSFRANLFVAEADRVPTAWVQAFRDGVERVIVPSQFAHRSLIRSGLPPERIWIVPYGFDEALLSSPPAGASGEAPFTFLSVLAPHWRKGPRELLLAYRKAFTRRDPVALRLKTTYDPGLSRRRFPFEIPSWQHLLEETGFHGSESPPVDLRIETVSDAAAAAEYVHADVLVAPSWGEAFGLAILEAMAAGLPVITTDWGGAREFVPRGPDLLPYTLVEAGDRLYVEARGARVAHPDVEALAARLRWHFENRARSRELGEQARNAVRRMTWDRAATELLEKLNEQVPKV